MEQNIILSGHASLGKLKVAFSTLKCPKARSCSSASQHYTWCSEWTVNCIRGFLPQVKQKEWEKLTCKSFVVLGYIVWDVVLQLAKLSLSLQSCTCSVADVADRLQVTVSVLKLYTEQLGPKLQLVSGQNEL
ncbi:hypothetical protein LSH36_1g07044 [Paralvinella palmiformis]|uniref:Uncharacterized protein n=1 Tax=Paralvinella palmiformis TaxID=53620 RepID=A0AAD9NHW1_9ANNE|nr:hypothetical protein LSH36_1g07044 [Paralvinella palmiformis]